MDNKPLGYILVGFSIVLIISLFFIKVDIDKKSVFLCDLTASTPNADMQDCPAHQSNISWVILFAFAIGIAILSAGVYLILSKTSSKKNFKVDTSKLDKEEIGLYNIIKEKESIYQSDLIKETGFSKVKITRILDKLESKNLIERKRRGMTNVIFLK